MEEKKKGISLFGLIGMVVSSCIGSGVFALTGQLSQVASPGGALVAWLVVGIGFLLLALSLNNLVAKRPDLHGIFTYASEGFGPLAGFLSGWGYWLSAWLGNVAFATMMMSTVGYFYPDFLPGNTIPCILIASVVMWLLTLLVIRGVESASFLNAIVMVCKVASIGIFILFALFMFNAGVFTADFWGTLYNNAVAAGEYGATAVGLGGIGEQVMNCMIIMMWVFIGIEGAAVVSSRAEKKSDAGKATVIGLICLLVIYIGASVLPYGYLPYTEIAAMDKPAMLYVFDKMAPGWGGAFISIAIIISVLGSWLSFTILPAETTSEMAEHKLLPAGWGKLNDKGAPQFSLLLVAVCTQVFMIITIFSQDAYNFAFSMCTVAIVVTWALASAFQCKHSAEKKEWGQFAIGAIATVFLVVGCLYNGWSFLLLTCVGYIPGFFVFAAARKQQGVGLKKSEIIGMGVIAALGVASLIMVGMGIISI
ncbi:basic amino acid/polyamine antiporter [Paraeggerthella hongkongensis]|uniref:Arginine-ornithine antiporter n=1 Tax=Paraeggerthella hongkongensis TaxID=230658 RepID=A0A3N0AYD2_9ACTN|nr:basic amino acid/polyamine antiporter [Paraeggerthella hongkongensis]RNL39872.1 arginine-ornithine antiporter [Paraeggerthella hongkongensis]